MDFDISANFPAMRRSLSDAARDQLPFALSLAINATAEDVKRAAERDLPRRLDRPTPFTRRGLALRRSSKRRLEAIVFFKDAQADYLRLQETGGTRRPKGRALVLPAAIRRNKFGNIARGGVKRALASPKVFSGSPKGRPGGIYQRRGKGLVRLVTYAGAAKYRPRLGFRDRSFKVASRRFPAQFAAALDRALRSAR